MYLLHEIQSHLLNENLQNALHILSRMCELTKVKDLKVNIRANMDSYKMWIFYLLKELSIIWSDNLWKTVLYYLSWNNLSGDSTSLILSEHSVL